uniref:Uncharacterized protein n=1 Tax=Anopheles minimus TaxID=112268 RepID=A0A182VY91_9DIPT
MESENTRTVCSSDALSAEYFRSVAQATLPTATILR